MLTKHFADMFFRGILAGLLIAIPFGPIGVLCMQRTLAGGSVYGLISGLGAATADAMYGSIAAFGLTIISNELVRQQFWLRLIGGIVLCYLGVKAMVSPPAAARQTVDEQKYGYLAAYSSTLFLTLTSPATMMGFIAIFAGFGIAGRITGFSSAGILVVGVFIGSGIWWVLVSAITGIFHKTLTPPKLAWLHKAAGIALSLFGVFVLLSVIL